MITTTGLVPGAVQVFGDQRTGAYGKYVSDVIDVQTIGHVPVIQIINGDGSIDAYLERSTDETIWGRQKNNADTKAFLLPRETAFLQDTLPLGVRYMRVVFMLSRFPDTSNVQINVI